MPGQVFTLGDGASIVTGGTPEPADFVLLDGSFGGAIVIAAEIPTQAKPALAGTEPVGAYFTVGGFSQVGTSHVGPIAGASSILSLTTAGTGSIQFAGLQAPTTWLLIDVDQGPVAGTIFVKSLTMQYPAGYSGATLSGTVDDVVGPAAAGQAIILPLPNSKFSVNHCPIHSVNCVLLPLETLPMASPLADFTIGTLLDPNDDDALLLPIVSDRDY
jgi:hypothetical protein